MTISIGLIPNKETVMIIQDSEVSYPAVGFTQDILRKIKEIDSSAVTGVIGNPASANEVIDLIRKGTQSSGLELRANATNAYQQVRERITKYGLLAKYGFSDPREILAPQQGVQIDPAIRDEVLRVTNDHEGKHFGLELMLAYNYDEPGLYTVHFPGIGRLDNNVKDYSVSGSGSIMAVEAMGSELARYRWAPNLSVDEGIDILMKAGKASEKHTGVGGPFEIVYVTRQGGKPEIVRPDLKKINMVMYLAPYDVADSIREETIKQMRDPKVNSNQLADYIKANTGVGIEFDAYFGLNGTSEDL